LLALAEREEGDLVARLGRLEAERDNLRAALTWCREDPAGSETGLRLAGAVVFARSESGELWGEGVIWLRDALAHPAAQTRTLSRGWALLALGHLASYLGTEFERARPMIEEGLAIAREQDDPRLLGEALRLLGTLTRWQGDLDTARRLTAEALSVDREAGHTEGIAAGLSILGLIASARGEAEQARALLGEAVALMRAMGSQSMRWLFKARLDLALEGADFALARTLFEESLARFRELGNKVGTANSLLQLGRLAAFEGDYDAAHSYLEESLVWYRELGLKDRVAGTLARLGTVAIFRGDPVSARPYWLEGLVLSKELGHHAGIESKLAGLAGVASGQGDLQRAARLLGAGAPHVGLSRLLYERIEAEVRAALGEPAFTAARAEGRAMSLDEAITLALKETSCAGD
jgi:tetratricopeptide (TPR) repeat protein